MLTGRRSEKLSMLSSELGDAPWLACDLTDQREVYRLAAWTGKVAGILHAAGGGYGWHDPLPSWQQMDVMARLNLYAGAELNRLLVPHMAERGRIVHVGSTASIEACGAAGYNAAKAALAAYVRTVGRSLAKQGIVMSAILPGAFTAPGNAFERRSPEAVQAFVRERLPRGDVGSAMELLPLIRLLLSDDASMMAGSCITIDAGETVAYG